MLRVEALLEGHTPSLGPPRGPPPRPGGRPSGPSTRGALGEDAGRRDRRDVDRRGVEEGRRGRREDVVLQVHREVEVSAVFFFSLSVPIHATDDGIHPALSLLPPSPGPPAPARKRTAWTPRGRGPPDLRGEEGRLPLKGPRGRGPPGPPGMKPPGPGSQYGALTIRVISASNLASSSLLAGEPFAILKIGSQSSKPVVPNGGKKPVWGHV